MQNQRLSILAVVLSLATAACAAHPAGMQGTTPDGVSQAASPSEPSTRYTVDETERVSEPSKRASAATRELHDEPVGDVAADGPPWIRLAAAEAQPQAVEAECPAEGTRVLLIGDSLSAGLAHPMARLAKRCGTPFYHHGVVGSHATQWVSDSWLVPQLERAKPTHVLLSMGGNDFIRNDSEKVQQAVDRLVAKIRGRGIELLWISPPTMPFEDQVGARQMWQQAIGGEAGADWYPAENLTIARASDRIHPTMREYRNLSGILWRWMSARTAVVAAA